jgi:hypothetical protein
MFQSWVELSWLPLSCCLPSRLICLAFIWLVRAWVGHVPKAIKPSECAGNACLAWKNQVSKLTTPVILPPCKIDFASLHITCWGSGRTFSWGYWAPWMGWQCLFHWKKSSSKVELIAPIMLPPPKIDFCRLPMTCWGSMVWVKRSAGRRRCKVSIGVLWWECVPVVHLLTEEICVKCSTESNTQAYSSTHSWENFTCHVIDESSSGSFVMGRGKTVPLLWCSYRLPRVAVKSNKWNNLGLEQGWIQTIAFMITIHIICKT